jgi:hypothetical protein
VNVRANFRDPIAAVRLDHLRIEQAQIHGPGAAALIGFLSPSSKMGRHSVEVKRETIARKDWHPAGCQSLRNLVHEVMGQGLRPGSERKGWDQFGARVARDPQPRHFDLSPHLEPKLIKLDVGEVECAHQAIVQAPRMQAGSSNPTPNGPFRQMEDPGCCLGAETFGNGV